MLRLTPLIAMLLLFAACGDDNDPASLEDYFGGLEAASVAYDEAAAPIDAELNAPDDPLGDFKRLIPGFLDNLDAFVDALERMEPPDLVAAEHTSTVEHGRMVQVALEGVIAELDAVGDLDELYAFYEGPAMTAMAAVGEQFTDGCRELQSIADLEGIEVDLRCG